jgi:TetR/AcrR family transcriptional regulator of autoinduction and epiphytic fitness
MCILSQLHSGVQECGVTSQVTRRGDAVDNRARILDMARQVLGDRPDASLDDVARAAGVVRRTVYGHFANRAGLLHAIAEQAASDVTAALERTAWDGLAPDVALARFAIAVWAVADRFRFFRTLEGRRDTGAREMMTSAGRIAVTIIAAGQRDGTFADDVPAQVLGRMLHDLVLSLVDAVNDGAWHGDAARAAVRMLICAGVDRDHAETVVAMVMASEEPS